MKFYDRAELGKYTETPEGYLHGEFPITRPGVFPYMRNGGSVSQVAKLPDEVFSKETIESANNKPLTNDHPNVGVDVRNFKELSVGMTDSDAHVEDNKLVVGATITDPDMIAQVKSGKQELSIGFNADVPTESGEYGGAQYDAAQRNIKINHIAIVDRGRAGHGISIHDSAAFVMDDDSNIQGGTKMATMIIDNQSFEADQRVIDAANDTKKQLVAAEALVAKLKKQLAGSEDTAASSKKEADSLKGERDALKTQLKDAQDKQLDQDALDKRIDARLALQTSAARFVGDSFDFKGKTDREVKVAAIKTTNDAFDEKDKSDDYINAFYDSAVSLADKKWFTHTLGGQGGNQNETDSVDKLKGDRANAYK
ncbi:head maturation protease [Lactobacillus phage LBR48]|uniref:Putative head protein n=1 Tax=Lactobacillus phage LBR48 TaxID=755164 RepID=D6PSX5_9CAUD|nr:head maturation protease [Lactobacillus phage LBR48]ADF83466.1 putative head protein [Lactobacillus phage LBR48]